MPRTVSQPQLMCVGESKTSECLCVCVCVCVWRARVLYGFELKKKVETANFHCALFVSVLLVKCYERTQRICERLTVGQIPIYSVFLACRSFIPSLKIRDGP